MNKKIILLISLCFLSNKLTSMNSEFSVIDKVEKEEIEKLRNIFSKENIDTPQKRMDVLIDIFKNFPDDKNSPEVARALIMASYSEENGPFEIGYETILNYISQHIGVNQFNLKLVTASISCLPKLDKIITDLKMERNKFFAIESFANLIVSLFIKKNSEEFTKKDQEYLVKILISKITSKNYYLLVRFKIKFILSSKIKNVSKLPKSFWKFFGKEKHDKLCKLYNKKHELLNFTDQNYYYL